MIFLIAFFFVANNQHVVLANCISSLSMSNGQCRDAHCITLVDFAIYVRGVVILGAAQEMVLAK